MYTAEVLRPPKGPACLYRELNQMLRRLHRRPPQGDTDHIKEKLMESWKPFMHNLLSSLELLPNFKGTVYRGLPLSRSELDGQYQIGKIVRWVAFASCSKHIHIAHHHALNEVRTIPPGSAGSDYSSMRRSSVTIFRLYVQDGKDLSALSMYPEECEVLITPLTEFEVVDDEKWIPRWVAVPTQHVCSMYAVHLRSHAHVHTRTILRLSCLWHLTLDIHM